MDDLDDKSVSDSVDDIANILYFNLYMEFSLICGTVEADRSEQARVGCTRDVAGLEPSPGLPAAAARRTAEIRGTQEGFGLELGAA